MHLVLGFWLGFLVGQFRLAWRTRWLRKELDKIRHEVGH
jgi:hypothetical protein